MPSHVLIPEHTGTHTQEEVASQEAHGHTRKTRRKQALPAQRDRNYDRSSTEEGHQSRKLEF